MKNKKLYIDDERFPKTEGWDIVRSYDEFVKYLNDNDFPEEISFDHDLADIKYDPKKAQESFSYHEKTGYDCLKYMATFCISKSIPLPKVNFHTANPIGRDNMISYFKSISKIYNIK